MKITNCPKCNGTDVYLFDEEWNGSLEDETFDYDALFCCDECGFEKKIYFWGSIKIDNKPFQDFL